MFKIFIVDDEYLARERVKKLLSKYSDKIQILGDADSGHSAIEQIENLRPDVLFLDIQMPDKTGFEVLAELTYQPMVIFTTAYEEYAIKAFDSFSVDYLVKPFNAERFKKAMEKLEKFGNQDATLDIQELATAVFQKKPAVQNFSFPVKLGDRILLIDFEDITHFQAEEKYIRVFTNAGKSYLCDGSLSKLEKTIPEYFIRVHRSHIVNQTCIQEVRKYFKGKLILILNNKEGTKITTGETYSKKVRIELGI